MTDTPDTERERVARALHAERNIHREFQPSWEMTDQDLYRHMADAAIAALRAAPEGEGE